MRKARLQVVPIVLVLALSATAGVVGPTSAAEARGEELSLPKPAKQPDAKVTPVAPIAPPTMADPTNATGAGRPVTWPVPGHRSVLVGKATDKSSGLVSASTSKAGEGVTADLEILDQAASARAGVSGVLVKAKSAKSLPDARLTFDYSGYADAFGADWDRRLRIVALPACVLTTPNVPACTTSTLLLSQNDPASKTVSTTAPLSAQPSVFAVTAGADSSTGNFAATGLSAASSWSGGGSSGDFTWSYPLRVPPAVAGPAPSLGFSYSAQSVDGRTSATNNQTSWVGEGFDLTESFVERKYTSCDEDGNTGKYDQCWKYDNATVTLNGRSNELVRTSGEDTGASTWKMKNDDGSKVEKVIGTDDNGDARREYWQVTTTDGTRYFFGKHKLKTGLAAVTNSVFTVPVFGDDDKEPCHQATFAASGCTLAWRWNLDYVVDLHGNAMSYWYTKETNNYAKNGVASPGTPYVRGGYLARIDYGLQDATLSNTTKAPQQVVFTTAERCLQNCSVLNATTKANWPDVPFDQVCEGSTACTNKVSPTFFTRKRLAQIQTFVLNGTTPQEVDRWQTTQRFISTGDSSGWPMWLDGISHSGTVGTALSVPNVTFAPVGLANRVDSTSDGLNSLVRNRIHEINTETGAKVMVNYAPKECMSGEKPVKDSNTKRCYPVKWKPPLEVEREDWFHKYVLESVLTSDPTGNGATMMSQYVYSGGGAWHFQESPMLKDADKTWSEWRGYGTVTTYTGDPSEPSKRSRSVTKYFRGMDGDKLEGTTSRRNVDIVDSEHTVRADTEPLAGSPREQITYQDANSNTEVSGAITDYVVVQKASQTVPGGVLKSNFVAAGSTKNRTARDGGRDDLVHATMTEFDSDGLPVKATDLGDATKTDETCTITSYAKDRATWLIALPIRTVTSTGSCDTASPNPPENRVLSDVRMLYDNKPYGTVTKGDATSVQRLHHYTDGDPSYQTTGTKGYDDLGRVTSAGDALGRITTMAYVPALTGPLAETTVTSPAVSNYDGAQVNFTTKTTYKPEWGLPSKTTDPNGKVTEMAYDALGRLTAVWLPSQAPAASKLANTKYTYTLSNTAASTIRTDSLNVNADGYLTSYQQFDSLLRSRQSQAPGANSGRLISETRYDSRGQAIYENADIWNSSAPAAQLVEVPNASVPNQTFNEYDGAGRNVKSTFMIGLEEKWSTRTLYGGDTTTVLPPAGGSATATVADAFGQVVEQREFDGNSMTGTPVLTKYAFDLAGRMTRMDGAGGTWTYKYDLRGRKVQSTDPDSGTSTSTYDEGDRLVSSTDSTNSTLVTTYDALDRKTGLYKTSVSPANLLSEWRYDKAGYLGQLGESTSYTDGKTGAAYRTSILSRNVLYKPTEVSKSIPAVEGTELKGSYVSQFSYMPDAKTPYVNASPRAGSLPGESVRYDYSPTGLPTKMYSSGPTYVTTATYDQFGQTTLLGLGSNDDMKLAYEYEYGTRRLSRSVGGKSPIVSDHRYTYDPTGNVTKDQNLVDSAVGGDTQCFDYDGNRRITEAWTPANSDCTPAPSSLGLGGVAPYWQSWTYTPTGLRKTQVDHSTAGDTTSTFAYNADQPHTLASVTQTGTGAAAPKSYDYDARGNTTVRPGQSLTWNAQGKLAKLSGTEGDTDYVYDSDGSLLVRRNPTEVTVFMGDIELTLNKATRQVLTKRQYEFNGQVIGVRSTNGTPTTDMSWLVNDYHGTSQVAVDTTTLAATKRYAKPFGDPRGPAATTWPDDHGFLGKPEDKATGLTTVGAREYDPTIGRFISVDPMLDANNPQQMLGYTYANDNPVSGSDPTGLMPTDPDAGGTHNPDYDPNDYEKYEAAANSLRNGGGNGGGGNDDGGTNHPKQKKKHWYDHVADGAGDFVDHAKQWGDDHAADIGNVIAASVAVVGVVAFCAGTAGVGCLIVAGVVMGASGASLGYGARIALDSEESFDTSTYANVVATGGLDGAASSAVGIGLGAAASKAVTAVGKVLVGKATSGAEPAAAETVATIPKYARNMYTRFSPKQRAAALAKAPTCPYCGKSPSTQADHITSQKRDWVTGGWSDSKSVRSTRVNSPGNLIGACQPCNGSKSSKEIGPGEGQWWPSGWPAGVWWPFGGPS